MEVVEVVEVDKIFLHEMSGYQTLRNQMDINTASAK